MKKFMSIAAFALLATAMTLPLASCGGDDDDNNGGGSKMEAQTFTVGGVSFKMMPVEGGSFTMGSPDNDTDAYDDEKPQHPVTLSDFYMGETEVTQALWKAVMDGANPSYFQGDNLPVEKVSWDDCQTFITKLNEMLKVQLGGKTFHMPTEAEWEYAARGGQKSKGKPYGSGSNNPDTFWYTGNSNNKTHPVGSNPNELGLCDMSGNVWEWCSDWYDENYYSSSPQTDPTGPATGSSRVSRGGSWYSHARSCRVSYRNGDAPSNRLYNLGLRLVLQLP